MLHKFMYSKKIPLRHINSNEDKEILMPFPKKSCHIYICNSVEEINNSLQKEIRKPVYHICIITSVKLQREDFESDFVKDSRILREYQKQ